VSLVAAWQRAGPRLAVLEPVVSDPGTAVSVFSVSSVVQALAFPAAA